MPDTPSTSSADKEMGGLLAAAIRVVSGFTLLSRFFGLARDILTAHLFGNSLIGSAFANAFAIPNIFRRLFGEGALSAAFIPEYVKARKSDPAVADRFAQHVVSLLFLVSGLITLVVEVILLVLLFSGAGQDPERRLSFQLLIVMLPMMPLVCLTAILGGMLQVQGKFGPPAAAPIILNLFQILAGGYFLMIHKQHDRPAAAYAVGAAALLASVVQVVWCMGALSKRPSLLPTRLTTGADDPVTPHTRVMFARFVPALIGLGTIQINTMLDQLWAMWPIWIGPTMLGHEYPLDETSNSILSYAMRLYQFPLGVFGIAVATAILPLLSRSADNNTDFESVLKRGLRLSLFIGLPASIGLVLIREPIITVLFSGSSGGFDADGLTRAAAVLTGFAPGVWAYSLNHVLTRAFYAKGDTTTPMKISMLMVALNLVLNLILIWPLREAGLAWATGLSAMIQTFVLAIYVRRKLGVTPIDSATLRGMGMVVVATLMMALCVYGTIVFTPRVLTSLQLTFIDPATHTWRSNLVYLIVATFTGMASFAAASVVLRLPEFRWLLQRAPKGADGRPVEMTFE
ncbi:MAG: murein biosynthesis integral membrane protein MurJ [Planctomycetes bacterium]|nr:murein biosynthesis integral membrane protein MurJ [Planctomycetota bacterium]